MHFIYFISHQVILFQLPHINSLCGCFTAEFEAINVAKEGPHLEYHQFQDSY